MEYNERLERIAASWYVLAGNVAGYIMDIRVPMDNVVEEVAYYAIECPGSPSNLELTSILGKDTTAKFLEVLARIGLRPAPLMGLEVDSLAYVFALAGLLAEAEALGDHTAPAYRLWLVEEVIEKVVKVLEKSDDYCTSLLVAALKSLIDEEKKGLES
jgi:hypothetical protein